MIAFSNFKEINALPRIGEKLRAWLKDYTNIHYSIAQEGIHLMKWQTEKKFYSDTIWSPEINLIGRKKNRTIIEFDGQTDEEIKKAKEAFNLVKQKFQEKQWGYIESTHNSKKTNYLWVEFNRDMKDKEVESFLTWICPEGAIIDLNFASSKKVFPILYAVHWKYQYENEKPIDYFEGQQVDYDSLNIPTSKKIKTTKISEDGFAYTTYQSAKIFSNQGRAELFLKQQPVFYDKNEMWWLWNPDLCKWEIVDEVDILNMIQEATGQDIIEPKNRTLILNSLKQQGRKKIPEPIKSTWIQFKNEIYDIETETRFKATPNFFVTNPLPWKLSEKIEETKVMDRIFAEWVGKDNVKLLYEILAYSMMPDYPIHRIFCFIGSGMNGKSKFLELLRKFVGQTNCCSTELDTLLVSRFEVTRLHKKLVCMMGETNFNEMSKTSTLKKLSGGDLIGFEYKNKNPFEEKNYAKIIIATNNLPATTDKTIGFYRRWAIIDFPNQFSEKKDILAEIPEEEYSYLGLKCCAILKELLINRQFTNEGTIEERQKKYEDLSNPLEKFMKEFIEEDHTGQVWKFDFSKKLNDWCRENRFREISDVVIGKKMKELGLHQELRDAGLFGENKRWRAWVGIKWRK